MDWASWNDSVLAQSQRERGGGLWEVYCTEGTKRPRPVVLVREDAKEWSKILIVDDATGDDRHWGMQ